MTQEKIIEIINKVIKRSAQAVSDQIFDALEEDYLRTKDCDIAELLSEIHPDDNVRCYFKQQIINSDEGNAENNDSNDESRHLHNADMEYYYNGEKHSYGIYSLSDKIGKNMTLLTTRHGAVIFDCGAEIKESGEDCISQQMIEKFLSDHGIKDVNEINMILVSHAHLDHYGSLQSLVDVGREYSSDLEFRIYMDDNTYDLINRVDKNGVLNSISKCRLDSIYSRNIKVSAFKNGHILGSVGYIVAFDNQVVIYTGDFCLHDQKTVDGLKIENILDNSYVKRCEPKNRCLITETTYGKRKSLLSYQQSQEVLKHFVKLLLKSGYRVFFPCFAIGRSQEIIEVLNDEDILIGENKNMLIDGQANEVTDFYANKLGRKLFNAKTVCTPPIGNIKSYVFGRYDIVIASSGMISRNTTSDDYINIFLKEEQQDKICVIQTGFIPKTSYGYNLLEHWQQRGGLYLNIPLSAHASRDEILELIDAVKPENIVYIHGEGL